MKEFLRFVKFALFSVSAGAIQIGLYTLLFEIAHWQHWQTYLLSLVASVIWNFTFNRKFTFKSANNIPIAMAKVAVYYAVFTPLTTWAGHYFVNTLGVNNYIVEGCTMALNFITEFLYQKFFVFGKSIDSAVKTDEGENK